MPPSRECLARDWVGGISTPCLSECILDKYSILTVQEEGSPIPCWTGGGDPTHPHPRLPSYITLGTPLPPRRHAVCPNASTDECFRMDPLVAASPRARFCAGCPIVAPGARPMDSLDLPPPPAGGWAPESGSVAQGDGMAKWVDGPDQPRGAPRDGPWGPPRASHSGPRLAAWPPPLSWGFLSTLPFCIHRGLSAFARKKL